MSTSADFSPSEPKNSDSDATSGCSRGALRRSLLSSGLSLVELAKAISNAPFWRSSSQNVKTAHLIRPPDFGDLVQGIQQLQSQLATAEALALDLWEASTSAEQELIAEQMRALGMEPAALDPLTPTSPSDRRSCT